MAKGIYICFVLYLFSSLSLYIYVNIELQLLYIGKYCNLTIATSFVQLRPNGHGLWLSLSLIVYHCLVTSRSCTKPIHCVIFVNVHEYVMPLCVPLDLSC